MARREYDESDARVRPSRRGSRPRSKIRPTHADAVLAVVTAVDRGRYTVELLDHTGEHAGTVLTAVKARELGRRGLVIGDRVSVVGDTTGADGTLARLVRREERSTELRRTADDTDTAERVIVANADSLAIVTALADPEPNARMIDRCLVAAFDAGMDAMLVLTKADLGSADALRAAYEPLGVTVIETDARSGGSLDADPGFGLLRDHLVGRDTVLVGYSGVGKSTLVNALVPAAERAVGHVNDVTGRGRHTSTSAVRYRLPDGGHIVDTPGVRSFGLAHVDPAHFVAAFPDVADAAAELCPRGCTHESAQAGCELDDWAGQDEARRSRVDSIRRLLASRAAGDQY
ncbi:ribosome small subunit-dependent GTPase A [Demequina capsici]|uniref:Small ribosomal subunit biogenesis GTPase RsgA n=1 Tax=Demequina capsici TaxID=3075620 RepID=A0AA96F5S4_9MICO|nr:MULTISPECIES: ribosome small subunit-dependent GTPase A [unclassified Demequina]WNM23854.1 ribosome small subunit-dependent GTPase A [Demequina sp. OYTSA14]WNM26693.1 ribosome small subunit-dependent GTPase A [Demequina sp. PMTSA13]